MLIYNKSFSVSPTTTHIALKKVLAKFQRKIISQVYLIKKFYNSLFKKNVKIAITGLNPHCESNFKDSEEKKVIIPLLIF